MRPPIRQLMLALLAGTLATGALAQPEPVRLKVRPATRPPPAALGELAASPLTGLYELTLPGQVVYVSADGRYPVSGRIIDLESRGDVTEGVLAAQRSSTIEAFPEKQMSVFEAKGERRHTNTTCTDAGPVIGGYMPAPKLLDSLESDTRSGNS